MRKGEPESFRYDLRSCGGAEKLAASAGGSAGAAADLSRIRLCDFSLREARADGLHFARIFRRMIATRFSQECDAAWNQDSWQTTGRGQRHEHRGKAFVARGNAEHAPARGQGTHQAPQDHSRIVAI